MPLDNADIQLISRIVFQKLYRPNTARAVVRDRSAEVVGGGDDLRVDNYLTDYNVQTVNYTRNLTYDDIEDGSWILNLNRRRSVEARVVDEILREKPYDAMVAIATEMTETFRADIDDYIVAQHAAATFTANDNAFSVSVVKDGSGSVGAGKFRFGTAEARTALVSELVNVYKNGLKKYWPEGAGYYALVSPEIKGELVKWMIETQRFGVGNLNDQALLDGAFQQALGYRIIVNHGIPAGDFSKASTSDQEPLYFGIIGETCHYAEQFTNFERMRDPNRFADLVRMMARYGAGVQDVKKIARVGYTVTDS